MGLKITLKRGERLFIAGGSIQNEHQNIVLFLEGDLPILREGEMMTADRADTPAKRLVLTLQKIYLTKQLDELHDLYVLSARDVLRAATGSAPYLSRIDELIAVGDVFKALKEARALVEFEASLPAAPVSVPASRKPIMPGLGTAA